MKTKTQDPKFQIEDNKLVGQSGPVPDDEPLFILRARDVNAVKTLSAYFDIAEHGGANQEHLDAIGMRIKAFSDFRKAHPDRMKIPDTSIKDLIH